MKKAAYRFGYCIGLVASGLAIVAVSPVLAAYFVRERWRESNLDNVEFVDFKRRCKKK